MSRKNFLKNYSFSLILLLSIALGGAALLAAARVDAEVLEALGHGSSFGVLDIAGEWAWGQADGESGPVGYVALGQLAELS